MSGQYSYPSWSRNTSGSPAISDLDTQPAASIRPSAQTRGKLPSTFWHDRLIEAGMILSLALYYLVANPSGLFHLTTLQNPLYSLPFLLCFAALAWYRLPFAIALLPLSFPYYYYPKTVFHTTRFSLVEIMLWTCVGIAVLQALVKGRRWPYRLTWSELRDRLGPLLWPMLLFLLAAGLSILVAYARTTALRAFREEVVGPLIFLGLALLCLRSRQDVTRLLLALLGSGLLIALIGSAQFLFFKQAIPKDASGLHRLITVYGSGNDIGLLFDYTFPIALALIFSRLPWKFRLVALALCLPFGLVLYQSSSRGSFLIAIPLALVFTALLALREKKQVLIACALLIVLATGAFAVFHSQITDYVVNGHSDSQDHSTALKRPWLWQTALNMIHDYPWLGVGMDNWLCHYSDSYYNACWYPSHTGCWAHEPPQCLHWIGNTLPPEKLHAYWITKDANGNSTGMENEPGLSHPHNIFLHVWVSIGIFGLLAFVAILVLFYWLFARLIGYVQRVRPPGCEWLRWLIVGVGAAMLAALAQGQIDSAFLEQDLAFCFWTLVTALLLLRMLAGMPWRELWPRRVHA